MKFYKDYRGFPIWRTLLKSNCLCFCKLAECFGIEVNSCCYSRGERGRRRFDFGRSLFLL